MKPLRIALWNNLPSGGGKRAFYELAAGLVKRGHHLESWCPPTAHREYLPLSDLMPEHVVAYERIPFKPRMPWKRLAYNCLAFRNQWSAMEQHCRQCAEQISAGKFDVLFATNCWDFAVPPIAKYLSMPRVIYHGEPKRHLYEARPKLPWVALPADENRLWPYSKLRHLIADYDSIVCKRVELREELSSVSAFDLVLVNSAFSRDTMLHCYGLDSRVCYLGINAKLFHSNVVVRDRYVVGLGGYQPHKGIDTAIAALATIPSGERPRLVWIGNLLDAGYRDEMIELANRLGVELETRHLVTDDVVVEILGRATLMIYTSHLEPFGFAPLEANACGTPVVAVAEGGVRETVQHGINGLTVPDRDPKALGDSVLRLLRDPDLARSLGEQGRRRVREAWTWEAAVIRLEDFLIQANRARR